MVKCDHHTEGCNWTGTISEYNRHQGGHGTTRPYQRSEDDQELIDTLEAKSRDLRKTIKEMEHMIRLKDIYVLSLEDDLARAVEKAHRLLKKPRKQTPLENDRGGYAYDRFTVVDLTQLICQDLENKPQKINGNKIFECVRTIYTHMKNDYADNPVHLHVDVRMLLSVCTASTWFSDNQQNSIGNMASEQGWW